MALAQGMRETRGALAEWRENPRPVLRAWFHGGFAFAFALLSAVLIVGTIVQPDFTPLSIPGVDYPADLGDHLAVIFRNGLVLALHGVACIAGFIAGSSLPLQAQHMTGWKRVIHERARPFAFACAARVGRADGGVPAARGLDDGEPAWRMEQPVGRDRCNNRTGAADVVRRGRLGEPRLARPPADGLAGPPLDPRKGSDPLNSCAESVTGRLGP